MRLKIATIALIFMLSGAWAQEHSMHHADAEPSLPPICLAAAGAHSVKEMGSMPASKDQAHQDLMAGMDVMNRDMMAGATAPDIDVAFVCSMIPHHRGAIAMAKAELAYGDDPWAKELAQAIVTAQEKEIADMLDWLAKQK
jgi:uncharacterized protein (DUF305 family)